jgi:gluconolactonase
MRLSLLSAVSLLCLLFSVPFVGQPASAHADDKATPTKPAKAGDLEIAVPEGWKKKQPKSQMRLVEYEVPAKEGDKSPGEFVIFHFGGQGGGLEENITRWVGQTEPEGRKVKLISGKSPKGDYTLVDVTGTYKKSIGPPIQQKTQRMEGWRVINVYLNCPGGPYFFKIDGPAKTVEQELAGLRATFGGDPKTEKERPLEAK